MGSITSGQHWYESQSQSFQEFDVLGTPTELSADTVDFVRQAPRQAPLKKPSSMRPPAPPPRTIADDGPRNGPRQNRVRPQSAHARCAEEAHSSSVHDHFTLRSASQDHGPVYSRAAQGDAHTAAERAARRRPRPTSAKALKHKRVYDDTDEPIVYDDPEEPEEWPDRHNWPQPALRPSSASRARTPSSEMDYSHQHIGGSAQHRTSSRPPSRPSSASAADHHRGPSPRPPSAAQYREVSQMRRGEPPQVIFCQP